MLVLWMEDELVEKVRDVMVSCLANGKVAIQRSRELPKGGIMRM